MRTGSNARSHQQRRRLKRAAGEHDLPCLELPRTGSTSHRYAARAAALDLNAFDDRTGQDLQVGPAPYSGVEISRGRGYAAIRQIGHGHGTQTFAKAAVVVSEQSISPAHNSLAKAFATGGPV